MQSLADAIGTLRVRLISKQPIIGDSEAERALDDLMLLATRYKRALQFYAAHENWIDNEPLRNGPDGLLSQPDLGAEARYALGVDTPLGIVVEVR